MSIVALGVRPVLADDLGSLSSQLSDTNRKAAETSQHISDIDGQLAGIQEQIADTQSKIADTNDGIAQAKAEMAGQEVVLGELMRQQYTQNNETGLEMLASSKNFSDFVDKREYAQAGQDKIATAVEKVVKIKKELEAKAAELAKLNAQLADAQNGLAYARAQAGQQLADIQAAQDALKAKLAKYSGGEVVAAGQNVNQGDLIGFEGTSGCATGPHLHFEVDVNGTPESPYNFLGSGMAWPVDAGWSIAQGFGPADWAGAPYSFHTGIDIVKYYGAPIYAAKSGHVIFAGYDRSGFGDHVIIDHGGGVHTIYGHMGARGSDYPNC
jgi:septal ring factor EnvC (AmiA/AmiB activator)